MSSAGGYQDEMDLFRKLGEPEIEGLLAGRTPAGREDLESLAHFARVLRTRSSLPPSPAVETAHLARIVQEVRLEPVAPSSGWPRMAAAGSRRRRVLSAIFGTLAGKVAIGAVAAVAATGGLAATGSLPAPAQDAIAAAMSHVGLHLPSPGDHSTTNANQHGIDVSNTARTTDATGREKGQQVSGTASTNSSAHRQDADHRASPSPSPASSNPIGYGRGNHASGGEESGDASSGSNPTGYGPGNHPTGSPTGYGADTHPNGNPTGYGQGTRPTGDGRP